jgi:putative endonuclease
MPRRPYEFWVYILTNQHDSVLYIGVTNDLEFRVRQHRAGDLGGFSARYHLHKLIYFEFFTDIEVAIAWEKQLKGWRRSKKVALINQLNPAWRDLFDEHFSE